MNWLSQIADDWKTEDPDRDFSRLRPLVRLSRLSLLMPHFQKSALGRHGITPSDYSILGALRRSGSPKQLMPGDLYNTLGCTPGGLTKMIDRLEKRGLVQRLTDLEDGRRARIRLTAKGEAIERKAFADYNESADDLMERLTQDQLDQIDSALELLLDCFEPSEESRWRSPISSSAGRRGARRPLG
ncbi:MAG: MarR family transcriptional regulator [bacterium]|nr:hypothetical protein [Deltaproteobacteria bacterium]MCP4906222.1 MarR family transcriptional regulator [bacterium]